MIVPAKFPTKTFHRLTDGRPIDEAFRRQAVAMAQRTTAKGAARALGVSAPSIRNWAVALGLKGRRLGPPTQAEVTSWGKDYPHPDFSLGKPPKFSATAR